MTTIQVLPNQSMLDVILQGTGSMETGMQFCMDNSVCITDVPVVGTEYMVSDTALALGDLGIMSYVAAGEILFGTLGPILPFVLWTSPIRDGSAPSYGVPTFQMTYSGAHVDLPTMVFYSEADETTKVAYLNSTLAPANGMTGTFAILGSNIVYNQGPGENWSLTTVPIVLPALMQLSIAPTTTSSSPNDYQYEFDGIWSYQVVDWGDSSAPVTYNPTVITVQTAAHTYTDALAGKTISIFHNNTLLNVLALGYTGSLYTLKTINGRIPICLIGFGVGGQQMTTPADIPIAGVNLSNYLAVGDMSITSFSPSLFSGTFNNLVNITVAYDELTSIEVDKLFNDFVTNTPLFAHGGYFTTFNQTPPAPPTAASAAARAALAAAGWTILTD